MTRIQNNERLFFGADAAHMLQKQLEIHPDFFLLCDTHTQRHCLPLFKQIAGSVPNGHLLVMQAGEMHKTLETATMLWEKLQQQGARRDSILLDLGGGVVCDMGGFVSATWKRGMRCIQIPTSLMAQADAAIGGKCALDFGGIKNQIGCFHTPEAVCIIHDFLYTLPSEEMLSGFGEMLKHGIVADPDFFRTLRHAGENARPDPVWIRRSAEIKQSIVLRDREEQGLRKVLNFGHSIGHVLEASAKGNLSHGAAVAHGMCAEARIAWRKGMLDVGDYEEIVQCIRQHYGPFPTPDCSRETMIRLLTADKKCSADSLNFSLPTAIGHVKTNCTVDFDEAWEAMQP